MLTAVVFVSVCAAVLAAPQYPELASVTNNHNMESMFKSLDIESMVKAFDPKFVVLNEQKEGMPEGLHNALVKSLISDLQVADIPVIYAQKRDITLN